MTDPRARTPRLSEALAEFDRLVKEQRELIVKDEMDRVYTQAGGTDPHAHTSEDRAF